MDIVASLLSTKANTLPLPTTDDTKDALLQPNVHTALFISPIPAAAQQQQQVYSRDGCDSLAIAYSMELKKSERL
jgi:hypothetical protein